MSNFTRRSLFGQATAAFAAQAGANYLLNLAAHHTQTDATRRLLSAISSGDGKALAEACEFPKAKYMVWEIHVSAKFDEMGIIARPYGANDAPGVGIVGNPNCDTSDVFPTLGLTKQFGDHMKDVESKIGLALCRVSTTNGNHVYDGYRLTNAKTGAFVSWYNKQIGSLLRFDFGTNATADMATGVFGPNGTQEISYTSLQQGVSAVLGALDPLASLPTNASALLAMLNDRVSKDAAFRTCLEGLATKLKDAKKPLQDAAALALVAQSPNVTNVAKPVDGNAIRVLYAYNDLLLSNPLVPQVAAGEILYGLGLISSMAICIGNVDTNGGGDHDNRGGNNVAFGQRSPNEVKQCVGQIINEIFKKVPNSLVFVTTDGGRSSNGGDSQNYTSFIAGPKNLIKTGFIGGDQATSAAIFGNGPTAVDLANNSKMAPNQGNITATVAKAAGYDMSDAGAVIKNMIVGA